METGDMGQRLERHLLGRLLVRLAVVALDLGRAAQMFGAGE